MADSLAGVVLAAGAGERLRPLSRLRPKVLCPVGDRPLVDHALARFDGLTPDLAVNVHHGRELLEAHLAGRVHLSFEDEQPLGTAGALGCLRQWIDGRSVLVANGDTWCPTSMDVLVDGWDGETIRVLSRSEFGPRMMVAGALMPWADVARIDEEPAGLYEASWRAVHADEGRVEVVLLADDAPCVDCGTPRDYLEANLTWSGGESVIGAGSVVEGTVEQCVLWPGVTVGPREHLVRSIRAHDNVTVVVR
jgi:NDP-sugar pyrophosphorylase family protein